MLFSLHIMFDSPMFLCYVTLRIACHRSLLSKLWESTMEGLDGETGEVCSSVKVVTPMISFYTCRDSNIVKIFS